MGTKIFEADDVVDDEDAEDADELQISEFETNRSMKSAVLLDQLGPKHRSPYYCFCLYLMAGFLNVPIRWLGDSK